MKVKKLSLDEAMRREEANRHNSALANVVTVLNGIADKRRALERALAQCAEHEAEVRALGAQAEKDAVAVNDSARLFRLHKHYSGMRAAEYTMGAFESRIG